MKSLFVLAALATALSAHSVYAFQVDDKTLNTPSASTNYSDPDEKTPAGMFTLQGTSGPAQFKDGAGNPQGPSSYAPTAAPFSPSSGYYTPRH
jgi:hypothetical protein